MPSAYTLALLRNGPRAEWSRVAPYASDAEAIAAARRIAEAEGRRSPEPVSLMVGRSAEEGEIAWLGGWDWDVEGVLCWEAQEPQDTDAI
ncbi:MAG TPA: hypothetical protein VJS38_08790 [Phenylobacterium sp.]|uniref:hypothetical protein n=1 Tax=Phenylobacterium sp. TaxID=1871053 RepID=UPI002B470EAF|nr:hypothetical protein [Phenylobacterium sp.]HKR88259.1 hypothetical protein [Phenylobacterium sp.]